MSFTPPGIVKLVEKFDEHRDAYKAGHYNEAQVRSEFIDPFFKQLGWDIDNEAGLAEAYKDVIHEDAIKSGGTTKAPDYCFRIGGTRKFFVEAKKPSVDLAGEPAPAYQLRRYAWSAKLPLSILTDFEEFAVYDCRIRPKHSDKAAAARVMYLTSGEYPARWDELVSIFSKDAVLHGSFDKYVVSEKKRGTAEVDDEFLKEIERWRGLLARNIALRNSALSVRELNFAVGRIIDRVIFLRMCEDRGIESGMPLQALTNGTSIYQRLVRLFTDADHRYNSGLFYFTQEAGREAPDTLTPELVIDDKVLKDIFRSLYYPESPYEFSVLPPDILGNVYEQFLGKVIHLTPGHQARVEEKPEVKKAGGVYYTPKYIVDYIVEQTVGRMLGTVPNLPSRPSGGEQQDIPSPLEGEGKGEGSAGGGVDKSQVDKSTGQEQERPRTPKQVSKLRILDPACGSGSFLVGAYRKLLDWHRDWYVADGPGKHKKEIYQGAGGRWLLTTEEKKRILLNSIFGVDIDPQAVEVTKLNLLLCVLENENEESINQLVLFQHKRALPDLASNIKCGNSLIGSDFYEGKQTTMFDEETRYRINAFDWQREFPQVFPSPPSEGEGKGEGHKGGFDVVIGNPPYIRVRIFKTLYPEQVGYLESHYDCARHVWDIYLLFFERALSLAKPGGFVSFIVPIQTLHQPNCESLRRVLLERTGILSLADLSAIKVFETAIVKNTVIVCRTGNIKTGKIDVFSPEKPSDLFVAPVRTWPQDAVLQNPGASMKLDLLSPKRLLCQKIRSKSWALGEICYVTFGLRSCAKGVGGGGKDRLITDDKNAPFAKPYLEGRDIHRYLMEPTGRYIRYIPDEMYSPRTPLLFETKKVMSQSMLSKKRIVATLDSSGYYVEQSLVCIIPHGILTKATPLAELPIEFILGTINSKVTTFYFGTQIIDFSLGGGLIHATPGSQSQLRIPHASESESTRMVELVEGMLDLHKKLAEVKTDHEQEVIQRDIKTTDTEIDKLVYELYGLTEEEIAIVEGETAKK